MKLDQPTNLRVEDYPDQAQWIGRLFNVLNPFIRSVQRVFDNNVDFSTNLRSVTRSFEGTSFTFPLRFSWPFSEARPAQLTVLAATAGTSEVALIPAWSYDASASEVVLAGLYVASSTGVASLTSGVNYKFGIRVTV